MENYLGGAVGFLWRIEWKIRQSGKHRGQPLPHFHLIVFNVRFIDKRLIRDWWRSATGTSDLGITWVDKLSDRRKHEVYIAKYCAKVEPLFVLDYATYLHTMGRHWGVRGPEAIPWHEKIFFNDIPLSTAQQIRTMGAKVLPWFDPVTDAGFTLFGKLGADLADGIKKLCIDSGTPAEYDTPIKGESEPAFRRT